MVLNSEMPCNGLVLSMQEVSAIIQTPKLAKHRCLLTLIYSCGLRISEALHLKLTDIDSKRMLIHVKSSKGLKDRIIPLSGRLLTELREYYKGLE